MLAKRVIFEGSALWIRVSQASLRVAGVSWKVRGALLFNQAVNSVGVMNASVSEMIFYSGKVHGLFQNRLKRLLVS